MGKMHTLGEFGNVQFAKFLPSLFPLCGFRDEPQMLQNILLLEVTISANNVKEAAIDCLDRQYYFALHSTMP